MPILRLAYTTQFLIASIAVFFLWSEIGGQSHLDLLPWYMKMALGLGLAFTIVKATAASVSADSPFGGKTLRWVGLVLLMMAACVYATYYVHVYAESDEPDEDNNSAVSRVLPDAWLIAQPGYIRHAG